MDNPFIKYMMKDNKEDIFHSSVYGKSQSGINVGSASSVGFSARQATDKNRQFVQGYDSAKLGNARVNIQRAKTYTPPANKLSSKSPRNPRISH